MRHPRAASLSFCTAAANKVIIFDPSWNPAVDLRELPGWGWTEGRGMCCALRSIATEFQASCFMGPHITSLPPTLLPAEAQDRAFRLGQRRDVSVYRFVAAGGLGSAGLQDGC